MPGLGLAEFPGIIMNQSAEELRRNTEDVLVPNIVRQLTRMEEFEESGDEPDARAVVFEGTLDEVQEHFLDHQWSDGLPVIPPTVEMVERFLAFTDRSADDVIGVLQPENREASLWSIAVNGVMAGCRPEYMPLLIAIVEAVAEPEFYLRDAGATPGWEPLIVVNGPIVKELNFNYETAALRVGRQANTSIARFLRLYMRNVAGLRIPPADTDKGSIAIGTNVVLAENEEAVAELGWPSFAGDRGFGPGENVVTVQSALGPTIPIYTAGDRATDHMETLAEIFGGTCAFWAHTAVRKGKSYPLLIVGPGVARIIARDGWTKADMRNYLHEHCKIPVRTLQAHAWQLGYSEYDLGSLHAQGIIPDAYVVSDDPDRLVPVFINPEMIGIVISGDPGRNQSKGFVQNHSHAPPTSRRIVLPEQWSALLAERTRR